MSESRESQTTDDLPFAAFAATYQSVEPWRITTDGLGKPTFHFRASETEFQQWRAAYESDNPVIGILTFVTTVRRFQSLAEMADKAGGIWSSREVKF